MDSLLRWSVTLTRSSFFFVYYVHNTHLKSIINVNEPIRSIMTLLHSLSSHRLLNNLFQAVWDLMYNNQIIENKDLSLA